MSFAGIVKWQFLFDRIKTVLFVMRGCFENETNIMFGACDGFFTHGLFC